MDKKSNLQKMLIQLSSPYKKTEAFKTFEKLKPNKDNSGFWKTGVGYVVKYENAKLINKNRAKCQECEF